MKKTPPIDGPELTAPHEEDVRRYFRAVEEHFIRLRGAPLLLSPKDVARVTRWHTEKIPLDAILKGIERYFERRQLREPSSRRRIVTLAYCETDILSELEEQRSLKRGAHSGSGPPEPDWRAGVANRLDRIIETLTNALQPLEQEEERKHTHLRQTLDRAIERLRALHQQEVQEGDPGTVPPERIEKRLEQIDGDVLQALLHTVGEEVLSRQLRLCEQELARFRQRMKPDLFRQTVERLAHRRIRQRYHLPSITLFSV